MRRTVTTLAAALLAAGGLLPALPAAAVPERAPGSAATGVAWGTCAEPTLAQAGAECGTLDVPVDRAHPEGPRITLALSRVVHTSAARDYQGAVLFAPNPLGGSGYTSPLLSARLPGGTAGAYDWIGFARRGLAPSVPALSCDPAYMDFDRPDYVPSAPADEVLWRDRTAGYAADCGAAHPGGLLDHMKTTDTAADMESIRRALGLDEVSVYAQSYGTYVAQVYSTLHPDRVRRMVLDSNVDPRRDWYHANGFDQAVPLEENLRTWFDWLAAHDATYHLGATRAEVARVWDAQLARVREHPAAGAVGPDEWIDVFLVASYFQQTWPLLGSAFSGWVNSGDGETLKALFSQLAQRGNDNTYAALLAEICTDGPYPADWATWRRDSDAAHALAPDTTWGNTWFNAPCLNWPARPGTPVTVDGSRVASALLVDGTKDAATPFEGSLEVRARYPHSSLIAIDGGLDHGGTLSGNPCVDGAIARYLADGTLPARASGRRADLICAPLPDPLPAG
ncbi:alpha/beta hydrolase [Streptomyces sp. J2-1]|uniref:alpha/beta hydrolase n=1 Tax=Streptomyces corallincola TaxID=2851888 RepID=UPI001C389DBD|nr:alpha/beta hydrolase [Streptomyces corallincola]MBV2353929.1 alpha/beta hydrolase [Streptomyces corallincola]